MESSRNNPPQVFFDTDVIINWLTKEEDPNTGEKLWKAPYKIIKKMEEGKLEGYSSLINILEIRFVLRRKKNHSEDKIKQLIEEFRDKFVLEIPGNMDILEADKLQSEHSLDPFDSIYFSISEITNNEFLLTRDKEFIGVIEKSEIGVKALTPEQFLELKLS